MTSDQKQHAILSDFYAAAAPPLRAVVSEGVDAGNAGRVRAVLNESIARAERELGEAFGRMLFEALAFAICDAFAPTMPRALCVMGSWPLQMPARVLRELRNLHATLRDAEAFAATLGRLTAAVRREAQEETFDPDAAYLREYAARRSLDPDVVKAFENTERAAAQLVEERARCRGEDRPS